MLFFSHSTIDYKERQTSNGSLSYACYRVLRWPFLGLCHVQVVDVLDPVGQHQLMGLVHWDCFWRFWWGWFVVDHVFLHGVVEGFPGQAELPDQ